MKGRKVHNGKPTQEYAIKNNKSSPAAINEALMIMSMIDAQGEIFMGGDVPNTFVQVKPPTSKENGRVFMKIVGELVDYLL